MSRTNKIVTENLKRWMDASENLKTQAALARAARVGQSYVSRILRGEGNPTVSILESLSRAFKRKPIDLLAAPSVEYSAASPINPPVAQEPPDERELLLGYRNASPEVREIMLDAARRATKKRQA
jgi:transcriptional regulator with XRE-family HTH domain